VPGEKTPSGAVGFTLHRRRTGRLGLLIILGLFAALAVTGSLVTPLFEGPDEVWHYAFADYLAQGKGLPVLRASGQDIRLRNAAHTPFYHFLIAAVIAPIDRSDFPDAFRFNMASPNITPSSISDRPNLFIHTTHENFPYRQTVLAVHLARLVSVALGVLTVLGVWQAARLIFPGEDGLALLAAALAAFVPQFVYGFGLINNDALAAAATVWLLVAVIQLMAQLECFRSGARALAALLAGGLLGISLMSKVGMIVMAPLPALALGASALLWRRREGHWPRLKVYVWAGIVIYAAATAVAGWWYVRNVMLYSDPLAWRQWQALAGVGRTPPTIGDFVPEMLGLFGTFWADFTMRVDRQIGWLFALISLAAAVGLARRALRRDWPAANASGVVAAVLTFGLMLALVLGYSLTIYEIPGRLLFPALPAIGLALALGLSAWKGRPGRWLGGGVVAVLLLVDGLAPAVIIGPAYARPVLASTALPPGTTLTSIRFGTSVELIGYRLEADSVALGQPVRLRLYWTTQAPTPHQIPDASTNVTLTQPDGQVIGDATVRLGTTVYPCSEWRVGEIVETEVSIIPRDVAVPTMARVGVGVINQGGSSPLPASSGEAAQLGRVAIRPKSPAPCTATQTVNRTFGEMIRLTGYRLEAGRIVFCWRALQPVPDDYTVFIHMFDARGQVVTTADGPPRLGNYPTSAWAAGETVEDAHSLSAWDQGYLTIGLYRLDTGERLTLDGTAETEIKITP
jgi:hypothetical protein